MHTTAADLWRLTGVSLAFAMRDAPDREVRLTPTAWLLLSGKPVPDFNLALVDDGPRAEAQLRDFCGVIRARALPALVFLTDPVADRLAPTADALGLQPAGRVPLMVHCPSDDGDAEDARSESAERYRVDPVTEATALHEANQVLASTFSLPLDSIERVSPPSILDTPGLAIFLARDPDRPVSTIMAVQVGSTVGIWNMATLPEVQRQGAGRAVLTRALAYHRSREANLFSLLATEAGKPLYERIEFRTLVEPAVWLSGQTA